MQTKLYALPEWDFVGGSSQDRIFTLMRESGLEYDLPGATASLAVVEFVNPKGVPLLTKQVPVALNQSGTCCDVAFSMSPADTIQMAGKYIYQITVKDINGNTSIPQRGYMYITENIDKTFAV